MPASRPPLPQPARGPALAMLQIADAPCGVRALDLLVKEAPVEVIAAGTVQSGHYLVAFGGQVEAAVRSFARAREASGAALVDAVLLADAEPRLVPAFRDGVIRPPSVDAGDVLGVVQASACPALLGAVDAALKGAAVDLVELRIADGLGGRALATVWGALQDVEAAVEIACAVLGRHPAAGAATTAIVPNADAEVRQALSSGSRLFREWRG